MNHQLKESRLIIKNLALIFKNINVIIQFSVKKFHKKNSIVVDI